MKITKERFHLIPSVARLPVLVRRAAAAMAAAVMVWPTATCADGREKPLEGLDDYVEQARAGWTNVGMAVAVVRGREVIYARGFGLREAGKAARVDPDTLFQVGSTSKAFTTAALGILVDEGKLHWNDSVSDYLPQLQLQDPWLARNLNVRDTVTHRSGYEDTLYYALGPMSPDEVIAQLRYITPAAAFRDSFHYSNLMYAVAGKVIEAASGMSWHDFVRRRLLQPLHMDRSGTSPYEFWDARYVAPAFLGSAAARPAIEHARDANVALPHDIDANGAVAVLPWQSFDNAAAAGAVVSSAADMAKWLILHLNKGRFDDRQLLRRETMRELHATQNPRIDVVQFPFDEAESYTMGWRRGQYRGDLHLSHGGSMLGFPAYLAMLPDHAIGIVVLSNGPEVAGGEGFKLHKSIAFWVFDRLLGSPVRDWKSEFLALTQRARMDAEDSQNELLGARLRNVPPSLPLGRYAGSYEDSKAKSVRVDVRVQNEQLVLSVAGDRAFTARLEHWHGDLFRLRSNGGGRDIFGPLFVAFSLEPTGKVASMSFDAANFKVELNRSGQ